MRNLILNLTNEGGFIYNSAFLLRANLNRLLKPLSLYGQLGNFEPVSMKFGIDRGTPIDRFWIEDFLAKNKKFIKGVCLEIGNDHYTKKFGSNFFKRSDILDIDKGNTKANIIGDLKNLKNTVKNDTYDCVILTHVLGQIDNLESAISEIKRITKKGGTVLVTAACFSPTYGEAKNYWRILPEGAKYLFGKYFGKQNVSVSSYGNVSAGQNFWVGMSQEDINQQELSFNDPRFPCITCVVAKKT